MYIYLFIDVLTINRNVLAVFILAVNIFEVTLLAINTYLLYVLCSLELLFLFAIKSHIFTQICLVQICCKYEICKALQPVQRWQRPNLHKNGRIRPLPHLHCVQSCAKLILATYLHKANLMQIRFFVKIYCKKGVVLYLFSLHF